MAQLVSGVALNVPRRRRLARDAADLHVDARSHLGEQHRPVDGLMINGLDGDGAVQQYFNNPMIQEMSYTTAGAGRRRLARRRAREHGHEGRRQPVQRHVLRRLERRPWQADNLTAELQATGPACGGQDQEDLRLQRRLRRPDQARQAVVLRGRPLSGRSTRRLPTPSTCRRARTSSADCQAGRVACEQGIDDQKIKSAMLRLTWQVSPSNKFSVYYDEIDKFRGHGMNAGDDPPRRRRSGPRRATTRRGAEVHQRRQQQAAVRRRLLVQLRGVRHHQPGRHQQGCAFSPRVVSPAPAGATRRW